jgi:hypothetical protein
MRNSRAVMAQRTWFIDDSASVENTGATVGSPVPAAERRRRMGPHPIWENGAYHIRYLATTAADSIDGECAGSSTVVYLHASDTDRVGVNPVAHTSSALDVLNTATNLPFAVTAGTLDAAASVSKRVRWTSGGAVHSHAWGTVNNSATKLRTTEFLIPVASFTAAPFVGPASTVAAPTNGDTFVVEDLRTITRLNIGLRASPASSPTGFRVVLDGISTTLSGGRDCGVYSDGSSVSTTGDLLYHSIRGCKVIALNDVGRKDVVGGYAPNPGLFYWAANMTIANSSIDHFTMQGDRPVGLIAQPFGSFNWLIGQIGMFDATTVNTCGIYIASSCQFRSSLPTVIYGSNNVGQPFVLQPEGALIVRGSTPVTPIVFSAPAAVGITTGGSVSRYSVPAYDTASDLWTEPRLMSIANLLLAVSSGGFGGVLNDPYTGARVIG